MKKDKLLLKSLKEGNNMKNKIAIVGAGGFGREVAWLIERINQSTNNYEMIGFFDDKKIKNESIHNYAVLGPIDDLKNYPESLNLVIAIGNAEVKEKMVKRIKEIKQFIYPNLIDPSSIIDEHLIGEGNIICAHNICTCDYHIKDFVILNLSCTVGHDASIDSYTTISVSYTHLKLRRIKMPRLYRKHQSPPIRIKR